MFGIRIAEGRLIYDTALPTPSPGIDEVMIRVEYAGVNRADLFQMQGSYPPPPGASPLPGLEVSGHIAEIGRKVHGFEVGDEVCALLEGGGYAEYACVAATQILPRPDGWTLREAGALPEALFTVWLALFHTAQIEAGETVLIHGGASGIGSLASQMVKAAGATAITTASNDEKCTFSQQHGAEACYNYKEMDFVEAVLEHYKGVDVVLDMVGGDYFQKNLKLLRPGGRMVSIAFLRGANVGVNLAPMLLKQLSWHGMTLRGRNRQQKAELAAELRNHCWKWLEDRKVVPPIDSEYPLQEAEKALKKLEQNLNLGKILLKA